jgi:hypothetical protein
MVAISASDRRRECWSEMQVSSGIHGGMLRDATDAAIDRW